MLVHRIAVGNSSYRSKNVQHPLRIVPFGTLVQFVFQRLFFYYALFNCLILTSNFIVELDREYAFCTLFPYKNDCDTPIDTAH